MTTTLTAPHYAHINGHKVELHKAGNGTIWVHGAGLAQALGHRNPNASIHYLTTRKGVSYRRFLATGDRTASKWITLKDAIEFINGGHMGTTEDAGALKDAAVKLVFTGGRFVKSGRATRPASKLSEKLAAAPVTPAPAAVLAQNPAVAWLNGVLSDVTLPYSTQVTALNARRDILEIQATIEKEQRNA